MATWQEFDEAAGELITEELEGRIVSEAIALGLETDRLEAVCPRCELTLLQHRPGTPTFCGGFCRGRQVSDSEVIYRVKGESAADR